MKKTNENDFMTRAQKMIQAKTGQITSLTAEIEGIKSTIKGLEAKINSFSDIDDISSYSRLKDELRQNKDRAEILERSLKAVRSSCDGVQAQEVYRDFQMKVCEIDQRAEAGILPLVMQIKAVRDTATAEKETLRQLFESWKNLLSSESRAMYSIDFMDSTGTIPVVTATINRLEQSGKL